MGQIDGGGEKGTEGKSDLAVDTTCVTNLLS